MSNSSLSVPDGYTTIHCEATDDLFIPIVCHPHKGVYDPIQFTFHCDHPDLGATVDCEVLLVHDLGLPPDTDDDNEMSLEGMRDRYDKVIAPRYGSSADAIRDYRNMQPLLCDRAFFPTRQGKGKAQVNKGLITIDLDSLEGWHDSNISTVFGGLLTVRLHLGIWWLDLLGAKFFPDLSVYLEGENNTAEYPGYVDKNAARWKASYPNLVDWNVFTQMDLMRAFLAIIRSESHTSNQFKTSGRPMMGYPAGFGLMQVDPPRNLDVIWNWKSNIEAGIAIFFDKLGKTLNENNEDVKKHHPPYTFEQGLRAAFAYYNGNNKQRYLNWNDASQSYHENDVKNYAVRAYQRYLAAA